EAAKSEGKPGAPRSTSFPAQFLRLPDGPEFAASRKQAALGPLTGRHGCRCGRLRFRPATGGLRSDGEFQAGHQLSLAEEKPDPEFLSRAGRRTLEAL